MSSPIMDKILEDVKNAMKAREMDAVTALRGLNAQIKDQTINAGKELNDEAVIACVNKAIKQREDSIAVYRTNGREDLATKEEAELKLFLKYRPEQLSEDVIKELVAEAIATTGAASKKEMGKVMAALMPKVKGKADGKLVNQIVQSMLP